MKQFYKDIIDFLKSEYSDGYEYNLEISRSIYATDAAELKIKIGPNLVIKITSNSMDYIYYLYKHGQFITERNLYLWQKELVDMIEGA
jgi:hypothetical protein